MPPLTLVGAAWARPGERFRADVPCEAAPQCPVARLCQNQAWRQEYRIVAVRPKVHDVCKVFEGGAQVVEVEPIDPTASFPEDKLKGTLAAWEPPVCHIRGCPNWTTCFNPAMVRARRYEVRHVGPRLECPMGHALRSVHVRPST